MTPRLTAETFCFAPAQTLASEGKVVVGRRLHHRAGVCTGVAHNAQGHRAGGSPLWPQWAARHGPWPAWPLVPHSRTLERPTLGGPSEGPIFFMIFLRPAMYNANVPYTHATSLARLGCVLTVNGLTVKCDRSLKSTTQVR